ncbi:MAG: hypothetical protein KDE19_13795 [Caldilineaceae bacterium]|nr:hypothetical protein [Caldilineaceae bacterium]
MNSTMSSHLEDSATANEQANQEIAPRRHSSRNILPVRTNVKAGGRDEIAARLQEWLASRTSEVPADEATV